MAKIIPWSAPAASNADYVEPKAERIRERLLQALSEHYDIFAPVDGAPAIDTIIDSVISEFLPKE